MLQKALEERTKISCTAICWMLLCTIEDVKQDAHVDLGTSIFRPKKKLGWIVHIPLTRKGMRLKIWPLDGIHRAKCKGYMLFIPFGTALFLRSDVPHAGCFGGQGNLRLHCAFQCAENIGNSRDLFYLDSDADRATELGNQDEFIYSWCSPETENPTVDIPVIDDRASLHWQQKYYLASWDYYVKYRVFDSTVDIIGPLPIERENKRKGKSKNTSSDEHQTDNSTSNERARITRSSQRIGTSEPASAQQTTAAAHRYTEYDSAEDAWDETTDGREEPTSCTRRSSRKRKANPKKKQTASVKQTTSTDKDSIENAWEEAMEGQSEITSDIRRSTRNRKPTPKVKMMAKAI